MSSASADVDAVPDLKAQIVTGDKDGNSPISAEIPDEVIIFKYRDKFFISKKIDKPWYRNLSILISAAAFFTSVATSMITAYTSYQQEKSQDLNAKRQSIQQLVGQYYATALVDNVNQFNFLKDVAPVTNCLQLAEPYKSVCDRDSNRSDTETQGVYSFNIMLGSISRILANEIDENISSNELIQTAQLQLAANHLDEATKMLNKAKERAKNSFEYLYASRSLGVAQASFGLLKESNNSFADALKSFTLYKDSNPPKFQMDYENAQTYLAMTYWSAQSNCDESMKYQGELDKLTSILPQFVRVPLLDRIRRNKDLVLSQTKGACKL